MPLIDFIRAHDREIIDQFESFARTLAPGAASMTPAELRDHAQEVLTAVVVDLGHPQTADEQLRKSMGQGTALAMAASGRLHADHRIAQRFDVNQVVAEFRALRASVLRLYAAGGGEADLHGSNASTKPWTRRSPRRSDAFPIKSISIKISSSAC
jgi:hypothetical protein